MSQPWLVLSQDLSCSGPCKIPQRLDTFLCIFQVLMAFLLELLKEWLYEKTSYNEHLQSTVSPLSNYPSSNPSVQKKSTALRTLLLPRFDTNASITCKNATCIVLPSERSTENKCPNSTYFYISTVQNWPFINHNNFYSLINGSLFHIMTC